ncbi:MAG: hypothetical protein AAGI08_00130 [Bacteroidota bacterium]
MPIRNYTSKTTAASSAGQMQDLLGRNGASRISLDYEAGQVVAVSFMMRIPGPNGVERPTWFRIAPDPAGMLNALRKDPGVPAGKCTMSQAERTAWKNKLDWLDAQLAEVAAGQARIEQLLLGYVLTDDGRPVYERLVETRTMFGGDHPPVLPAG